MIRHWKCAFASIIAVGGLSSASAADLPLKAPPLPVAAVYSWTGCYIGGSGGGLWAHKRWVENDPLSISFGQTRFDHTASGGMAGGEIGCDYQAGRWVFGIEGSYHWADANVTSNDRVFTNINGTTDVSGLGTVTGRVGYAVLDANRGLIYLRGGAAFERDRYTITNITTSLPILLGSENRTGGLIGAGFEYLFTKNLSGFVEYDYIDMGTRTITLQSTNGNPANPFSIRERKDVVKVGLNWRFNTVQPVVARY